MFKFKRETNYSTTLGGKSFKELEELRENKVNNKLNTNTYLTREEYQRARVSKELQELEQELRTKQGQEFFKERVKLIKQEIKYKEKQLRELGESKSKEWKVLTFIKKLFNK